jgi:hypothetical protein
VNGLAFWIIGVSSEFGGSLLVHTEGDGVRIERFGGKNPGGRCIADFGCARTEITYADEISANWSSVFTPCCIRG